MKQLTIPLPEELNKRIEELPEDKTEFALGAIQEKLAEIQLERSKAFRRLLLSVFNKMTKKSTLTDKDCIRLGKKIKAGMWKKYKKEGW